MIASTLFAPAIRGWLTDLTPAESFSLTEARLADSDAWSLQDGSIRHRTGRFFSVIGVEGMHASGQRVGQALLDQREVGTLALIASDGGGAPRLLVQAKAEPGNVGLFQLAPSFQATASNAACVHGGSPPPFAALFATRGTGRLLADSLQSEQGTRFFGKLNRNCTLLLPSDALEGPYHRWIPARDLLAWLDQDHLLNTDIRSTLVCSDWEFLASGDPFPGQGFAAELRRSWAADEASSFERVDGLEARLAGLAPWQEVPRWVPLERLSGWALDEQGPHPLSGAPYRVRHIRVHSASREVTDWDQPIVASAGVGRVTLPVARWRGVLHFLVREVAEPGFGQRVELTAAVTIEPGGGVEPPPTASLLDGAEVIVACKQSEEGGRFLFDENAYSLVELPDWVEPPPGYHWLTLRQLKRLADRGGRLTNEARSALSLTLRWL